MKPIHILGNPGTVGFQFALELSIVAEGVAIAIQIKDPRDPAKRIHRAPFVIPTNTVPIEEKRS